MRASLIGLASFVFSSLVASEARAQMLVGGGEVFGSEIVTFHGTIETIEIETRVITVIGPLGEVVTVSVAPAVPLHHLRVRDEVTVDYRQQVVLELRRGAGVPKTHDAGQSIAEIETSDMGLNAPTAAAQTSVEFTPSGERIYRTEEFSATIKDVNRAHRVVTLYGEHGHTRKITIGPEIDLDMVEPGDRVVVLVTETEAINVRRR